jgi:hypothetical protein
VRRVSNKKILIEKVPIMVIAVEKHYKLHVFIFSLLSIHLFILVPIAFISKFLAVAVCIGVLFHIREVKFEFKRWYEVAVFVVVNAYLTFAIFGYDLFISYTSNLSKLINITYFDLYLHNPRVPAAMEKGEPYINLVYYGLGFIWTSYVLQSLLNVLKSLGHIVYSVCSSSKSNYWKKWLILLAILFAMFMIWQRAFNPIVMSPDSWGYISGWQPVRITHFVHLCTHF